MADPLSIAASIAGLVTLADVVFVRLVKFGRSIKNAEQEIRDLAKEINLLGGTLNSLSRLASALEDESFDGNLRMYQIEACNNILVKINEKLGAMGQDSISQFSWPFSKRRIQEWLEELTKYQKGINAALNANSMDALLRILAQGDRHTADIKEIRKITERIQQNAQRQRILNFFLRYNPQQNYDMSLRLRHPRTGLWLTRLPKFQEWLTTPGSKLWLKGIPGAGKTVLAGTVIEAVLRRSTQSIVSAFFFCDYKATATHTPENILAALVYQLALQREEVYEMLEQYHDEKHPPGALDRQLSRSELERLLRNMVNRYGHVYLVIDGLDECGSLTDDVVETLYDISNEPNVSMALLSRDEDAIRDRLEGDFTSVEILAHQEDITEYVTAEIAKRVQNRKLRIDDTELKADIIHGLIHGAKGMFRWVSCQLDHLEECDSDQECRDALKTLPPTLDGTYTRILQRVPKTKTKMVQLALNCIAYAWPKLTLQQLREILSVPLSAPTAAQASLNPKSIIREEAITRYCSSLLRKSADGDNLEFSHFTVQEFLEKDSVWASDLGVFGVSKERCYTLCAIECLKYIQLKNFGRPIIDAEPEPGHEYPRGEGCSLYKHAAARWPVYATGRCGNPEILGLAKSLFHPRKTPCFTSWAVKFISGQPIRGYLDEANLKANIAKPTFTPLHMAALLSLPEICLFLLDHGIDINIRSAMGTPMQCAVQGALWTSGLKEHAETDHQAIAASTTIRCLHDAGAPFDSECSWPYEQLSLLQVSFESDLTKCTLCVPTILVQLGIQVGEGDVQTAASKFKGINLYNVHVSSVCLHPFIRSLEARIDQSPGHLRLCSLAWKLASHLELEFTSELSTMDTRVTLTESDLKIHAMEAVMSGSQDALKRILKDPRINASSVENEDGSSLLHLVSSIFPEKKSVEILKMLLDVDCDPRKTNRQGQQPFHVWDLKNKSVAVSIELVQLLAEAGASCSFQDSQQNTAFHVHIDTPEIIEAFLNHLPANDITKAMEAVDQYGYTPLSKALERGYDRSASVFMEKVTITPTMLQSPTAVQFLAAKRNFKGIFELACLRQELVFPKNETPLHHLGSDATVDFVQMLKTLYPQACGCRFRGELPLQTYLKTCLQYRWYPSINLRVIDELYAPDSSEVSGLDKNAVWEQFVSHMLSSASETDGYDEYSYTSNIKLTGSAGACLLQLGYLDSYESRVKKSGVLPILEHFGSFHDLSELRLVSTNLLCQILQRTKYWPSLQRSPCILRLLQAAVASCDIALVTVLLANGVSVHDRISGGASAVERFCLEPPEDTYAEEMLDLLLDHADTTRINDINSDGLALIHIMQDPDAGWVIQKLVQRGADPNLRAESGNREPAMLHHMLCHRFEFTSVFLRNGSDPTLRCEAGFDAVLIASWNGSVSSLEEIYAADEDQRRVNWQTKCKSLQLSNADIGLLGTNAMHLSAGRGLVEPMRFFMEHGLIDIDARSDDGYTSLHIAVLGGSLAVVKYLCASGCDVNARTEDGSSPLHLAAKGGSRPIAATLVKAGCLPTPDSMGLTPVVYAYDATIANLLRPEWIDNINVRDGWEWEDTIWSVPKKKKKKKKKKYSPEENHSDLTSMKLGNKALVLAFYDAIDKDDVNRCKDLFAFCDNLDVFYSGHGRHSPFLEALEDGRLEIVRWMLEKGVSMASIPDYDDKPRPSAIHLILEEPDFVEIIPQSLESYITHGGPLLGESCSLLSTAVRSGNVEGLKRLLQCINDERDSYCKNSPMEPGKLLSAVVNEFDSSGMTPLHLAAKGGNLQAACELLESGAEINALSKDLLQTPLQLAIQSSDDSDQAVALYLISQGANLEYRDTYGKTALFQAASNRSMRTIEAIRAAGGDFQVKDFSSNSVLHYLPFGCEEWGVRSFAELIRLDMDIHTICKDGDSPFHVSICSPHYISLLLAMDLRLEDSTPFAWVLRYAEPLSWITKTYKLFLKKYGREALKRFANLTPDVGWTPLCIAASFGNLQRMGNLLDLGSQVDFDGSPLGSALMVACVTGNKEAAKYLVRRQAALSYSGPNGFRSAFDAATKNKKILQWLLVGRFVDQRKLASNGADNDELNTSSFAWGGPVKIEVVVSGDMERRPRESCQEYWSRLESIKIEMRGKVPPLCAGRHTIRPSNLVPNEFVRVHPEGYVALTS